MSTVVKALVTTFGIKIGNNTTTHPRTQAIYTAVTTNATALHVMNPLVAAEPGPAGQATEILTSSDSPQSTNFMTPYNS